MTLICHEPNSNTYVYFLLYLLATNQEHTMAKEMVARRTRRSSGIELENDFAQFMEDELDCIETTQREIVNGKIATRPYEVDVHGVILNKKKHNLYIIGIIILVFGALSLIIPELGNMASDTVALVEKSLIQYSSFIFIAIGGFLAWSYHDQRHEHIWVECKDLKTNVKRDHVIKLINAAEDLEKNEDKDMWHAQHLYLVSGSNFDQDSLAFADEHDVACYRRDGDSFVLMN